MATTPEPAEPVIQPQAADELPARQQLELFSQKGQGAAGDMAKKSASKGKTVEKPAKSATAKTEKAPKKGRGKSGGGGGDGGGGGGGGTLGELDTSLESEAR